MKKPALKRKVTTYTVVTWELDWEGDEPPQAQPAQDAPAAEAPPPETAAPANDTPAAEQPPSVE